MKLKKALFGFVSRDTRNEERLKAACGEVELDPPDLLTVLFLLSFDADEEVSGAAKATLGGLGAGTLSSAMEGDLDPLVAKKATELKKAREEEALAGPEGGEDARKGSEEVAEEVGPDGDEAHVPQPWAGEENLLEAQPPAPDEDEEGHEHDDEDDDGIDTSSEESIEDLPIIQQIRNMTVSEKVKLAMTGDKEIRGILIKDANKQISSSAIANPRITEDEILRLASTRGTPEDLLRLIAKKKDWMKSYRIRSAMVTNPKTPVAISLRCIPLLNDKDLASLSRSKNIPNVLSSSANRILKRKRKH